MTDKFARKRLGGMCTTLNVGEGLEVSGEFLIIVERNTNLAGKLRIRLLADRAKWPVRLLDAKQIETLTEALLRGRK